MENHFKELFLLDPKIHFLNHGSFGACPRPVFETYQNWQRELENQPVEFLGRRATALLKEARQALADFLNCPDENLVFFPNPTTSVNMVVRSLQLQPGDEILASNHEYGAMDRTWRFIASKTEANYVNHSIPLPVSNHSDFIERFWEGVTPRTRVIFLSHITSQTALIFPVAEICSRARQEGILTIIDGAHAPGQVPLDLSSLGADLYTGACHKWLCAPKGAAFLYAADHVQPWLEPLVVSWGYQAEQPGESQFIDYHEWQGTNWPEVRHRCRELLASWREPLLEVTGLPAFAPDSPEWWRQMGAFQLPEVDTDGLKARLYEEFSVEVPIYRWEGKPFLRVSVQAYNTEEDLAALVKALRSLLPQLQSK
jgi:isopenicillin-N epimerase